MHNIFVMIGQAVIDRTSLPGQSAENTHLTAYDPLDLGGDLCGFVCDSLYPRNLFHIDLGQDRRRILILSFVTY